MTTIVIVTHNNASVISRCVADLAMQENANYSLCIIDAASSQTEYLEKLKVQYPDWANIHLYKDNLGFCRGNNEGVRKVWDTSDYILFLNPDAFLPKGWLAKAIHIMDKPEYEDVGIISGPLLGYNIAENKPTGLFDSLGIEQTWYGRWFDRGQGMPIDEVGMPEQPYQPNAICGALMFCRKSALKDVLLPNKQVFDESFFMYKEDIDLSLRMSKNRSRLLIHPDLWAYHCRGWNSDRKKIPKHLKLFSARNELKLHYRQKSIHTLFSLAKWLFVKYIEVE